MACMYMGAGGPILAQHFGKALHTHHVELKRPVQILQALFFQAYYV